MQAGQVETSGDILVLMGTAPVHYSTLLHGQVWAFLLLRDLGFGLPACSRGTGSVGFVRWI